MDKAKKHVSGDAIEQHNIEEIKSLWKRYGIWIALLVVIIVVATGGYFYDVSKQRQQVEDDAMLFESISYDLQSLDPQKKIEAQSKLEILSEEDSIYGDFAKVTLAKLYAEAGNTQDALSLIDAAQANNDEPFFVEFTALNEAAILADSGQAGVQEAITLLDGVNEFFFIEAKEMQGDLYQALGNIPAAKTAYRVGVEAAEASNVRADRMDTKLKSLPDDQSLSAPIVY